MQKIKLIVNNVMYHELKANKIPTALWKYENKFNYLHIRKNYDISLNRYVYI